MHSIKSSIWQNVCKKENRNMIIGTIVLLPIILYIIGYTFFNLINIYNNISITYIFIVIISVGLAVFSSWFLIYPFVDFYLLSNGIITSKNLVKIFSIKYDDKCLILTTIRGCPFYKREYSYKYNRKHIHISSTKVGKQVIITITHKDVDLILVSKYFSTKEFEEIRQLLFV